MAKKPGNRRDSKHRVLRRGESIRADREIPVQISRKWETALCLQLAAGAYG